MKTKSIMLAACACLGLTAFGSGLQAIELTPTALEREFHQVRFEGVAAQLQASQEFAQLGEGLDNLDAPAEPGKTLKKKSPLKAFLLSAILPGAGQFYNGGRIKPAVFLGIEVGSLLMRFNKEGEADDATDEYQAFNHEHWSRETYAHYLTLAYGKDDDDSLIGAQGITHHLPDEDTQQFFEMTGKYNQFAWAWDDAIMVVDGQGLDLDEYAFSLLQPNPELRIVGDQSTPATENRVIYEGMRKKANDLYNTADTWLYVTIANHLISGFEAYLSAKKHNRAVAESDLEFTRLNFDVSLKSYHALRDTPYLKLSYKF